MKQTIAISAFAGMLARQSGYTSDFCEHFVIEMFKTVADALKETDSVTIKGLGIFSVDESGNVAFSPDVNFAAEINAPFDCFEPEPLDDDVTDEILLNFDDDKEVDVSESVEEENGVKETETDSDETANASQAETQSESSDDNSTEEISDTVQELNTEVDSEPEPGVGVVEESEAAKESESVDERDELDAEIAPAITQDVTEPTRQRRRSVWAFICGVAVGAIVGAGVTYFLLSPGHVKESVGQIIANEQKVAQDLGESHDSTKVPDEETVVDSQDSVADSIMNVELKVTEDEAVASTDEVAVSTETNAAEAEVYDTVKTTLAQLSRKHYGRYEFWVYIYEENRDVISDPDRVEPDTRLRIPAAEKYGINARDNASVNKALKKAQDIAAEKKSGK